MARRGMRRVLAEIQKQSKPKNNLFNICLALVFIILVSVTIIIRIRTLNVPLDRDEGEYAYAGQLMFQGVHGTAAICCRYAARDDQADRSRQTEISCICEVLFFLDVSGGFGKIDC
jgi:hypothetical protein